MIFAAGPDARPGRPAQPRRHGRAGHACRGPPVRSRSAIRYSLDQLETEHIRLILRQSPTLDDAARILGIDPSTLYRKRKQLGF